MGTTSTREHKIKQLEDENTLLRDFVEEVRDTALSFITTATGVTVGMKLQSTVRVISKRRRNTY